MERITEYIDSLFAAVPRSAKAKKCRAELLKQAEHRYKVLSDAKWPQDRIYDTVLSELDTAEDIEKKMPKTGEVTNAVAVVFFIIFFVSCFVDYYISRSPYTLEALFTDSVQLFRFTFLRPLRFAFGAYIILYAIVRYSGFLPRLRVRNTALRIALLVFAVAALCAFIAFGCAFMLSGGSGDFAEKALPLLRSWYALMAVPGICLFLGLHA
ncbi:MAG: hypothetical protein ILP09_04740 [Oscillospiraceae bacterium]|nr:hypothetical protein [Oscillospiraceae bacterium]